MDIPLPLEIIVTILLFVIAAVGGILAYFVADIRSDIKELNTDIKELRAETQVDRENVGDIDKRVGIMETRINICHRCPTVGAPKK